LNRSGEVAWKHKTSDYVKGIGISADGELTVVGSYDRYIYAIKSTGKLAWRYKTENYVRAVDVSADGEYVAAGSWRGTVYYLDKRGKLLWKQRIGSPIIDLSVSGDGSLIVAGCEDGTVHVYDASGEERWHYKCGGVVTNVATSRSGNRTAVASKDTLLVCLDQNGAIRWKFHLGGSSKGLYLIQDDEIVVAFTDNNFLQYVDSKGELMFMRRIPDEIWEGAVADDGISVAVATKDNRSLFFENTDLAGVVLEATQLTLEKVISDNIDITKAQEMHRHAGELLSDGDHGEAVHLALESQTLARKMHSTQMGDRAKNILEEVDTLIAENSTLDMRKAIRYLEKARRGLQEVKLERVIFYGEQARVAAEDAIDKGNPAVEDELFTASLGEPLDTDETDVDRLLGMEVPEEPSVEAEGEDEDETGIATELADEIGDTVPEMGGTDTEAEGDGLDEGLDEGLEEAPEEPEEAYEGLDVSPSEEEEEEDVSAPGAAGRLEALGEPPEEIPVDLYADPGEVEGGAAEEEPEEGTGVDEEDEEPIQDVCPECGQTAEVNEDGNCMNCISEQVMKFAVDNAKQAHKNGMDIGGLAPDLKAVKAARQEKDYDEVIAISDRIVDNLEGILGEDLQDELNDLKAGKKRKKKRKKVVK
jgi:outer membrane protein assembly factor BamB